MRVKSIRLTDEELRTVVWALSNQYPRSLRLNAERGRSIRTETTDRLSSISAKCYAALVGAEKGGARYEKG